MLVTLAEMTGLVLYVLSLLAHISVVVIIMTNVIPAFLGKRLRLKDLLSYALALMLVLGSLKYIPALVGDALIEGYEIGMPKYLELVERIKGDIGESRRGTTVIEPYESMFSIQTATPSNPPTVTPVPTKTPEPTLDMNIWNVGTPAPTPGQPP